MWNKEALDSLLQTMPYRLSRDDLKEIQEVIDDDRFESDKKNHREHCEDYAPFCVNCDKSNKYPCAVALIKMQQAEGEDFEIDNTEIKKVVRIAIAKRK